MKEEKLHILIPTAGTTHCAPAVRLGARIARQAGGQLTLLTVVQRRSQMVRGQAILDVAAQMVQDEVGEQEMIAETRLSTGQPARVIINAVREEGIDLVVMGNRPWHQRLSSLLGSTSQAVLAGAACPVLIARGDIQVPQHILLCDSGAASPRLVERFTHALPALLNEETALTVLHVMSQMGAGPGVRGWQLRADAQELLEAHTPEGDLLASDVLVLKRLGVEPLAKIRHGLVVEEIMTEAEEGDYDLVVIGAHQRKGWQDLLLDDLEEQIVACLDRPVLVVR
jgi:nucleotide-binding universal stress UspA family protein